MIGIARAKRLFADLAASSADPPGFTRPSFGPGEHAAHALLRREAEALRLETRTDEIGHLYVTLPGLDRHAPILMTGSHLDSVPHGGNYDGAAGVLAGLVLLERLAHGPTPPCDVTVMAIRAEEMIWFPEPYLGSRAAFGLLPRDTPDRVRRSDSGRTLADHMAEAGFDPQAIRDGRAQLNRNYIRAFVETHIEQGPVLADAGCAVGIVTGIRGNLRHRYCRIEGETTHAGGVPRDSRRDAVLAGAEFVHTLETRWREAEEAGLDLVLTFGEFATDPEHHGITKVPGFVSFTLDMRSQDDAFLKCFAEEVATLAMHVSERRKVHIDLGPATTAAAASLSPSLRQGLVDAAHQCGVPYQELPSGGGHDCATFAAQGVESAMVFIRNWHGSHNPNEHMELDDFACACDVLTNWAQSHLFGASQPQVPNAPKIDASR